MASVGPWGTFIHIPKCAGQDTRYRLQEHYSAQGDEIGGYHAVPGNLMDLRAPYFAIVRHPVTYLRSLWHYRNRHGWVVKENPVPNWPAIVGLTQPFACDDWGTFVDDITAHNPGVVSAIYRIYYLPMVRYYKLEHMDAFYDAMGFSDEVRRKPRQNTAAGLPTVTSVQAGKIISTETWAMETFGYEWDWHD